MLTIIPTSQRKLTQQEIVEVHAILQKAYEITEVEIWGENYDRLFIEDFTQLVDKGNVYVAYLDNKIVGSVHCHQKDAKTFKFSLLSVDFNYGGKGIGTALINRVEEEAIKKGATHIKIEILRVRDKDVPHKLRLANYYKRLGYQFVGSEDCSCIIPAWKYKRLIAPSNFDFYQKEL